MPDRTTTAALREFEAAVDGIGWLWRMCAADLVVALHGKMRARDLVVDRDPPWLPVDRGRRPARFLDDLVRTGHAEHSHQPALLTVARRRVTCREAYRLTRKGREAALELLRLGERREPATREALEVLLRMLDPPVAEAEALRRHYAEAVVRG